MDELKWISQQSAASLMISVLDFEDVADNAKDGLRLRVQWDVSI